ncbi:hypothetical protein [Mesorhizobium sp. A623]
MNRIGWLFGVALLLSGCGNCNILGGGKLPAHCDVGLAAGAVVLAPVAIPMAIADDAKARNAPAPAKKKPARVKRPKDPYERALYKSGGVEFED